MSLIPLLILLIFCVNFTLAAPLPLFFLNFSVDSLFFSFENMQTIICHAFHCDGISKNRLDDYAIVVYGALSIEIHCLHFQCWWVDALVDARSCTRTRTRTHDHLPTESLFSIIVVYVAHSTRDHFYRNDCDSFSLHERAQKLLRSLNPHTSIKELFHFIEEKKLLFVEWSEVITCAIWRIIINSETDRDIEMMGRVFCAMEKETKQSNRYKYIFT